MSEFGKLDTILGNFGTHCLKWTIKVSFTEKKCCLLIFATFFCKTKYIANFRQCVPKLPKIECNFPNSDTQSKFREIKHIYFLLKIKCQITLRKDIFL